MDLRLNADALATMDDRARTDGKRRVNSLNADALANVDGRRLDHRLRADRQHKLNGLSVVVAEASANSKRRKANV